MSEKITPSKKCKRCNYGKKIIVDVRKESRMYPKTEAWTEGYEIMYECQYCGWISVVYYFDVFGKLRWGEEKC